jgi:hypothetical protein
MNEQTTLQQNIQPGVAEPSIYEQMWRYMYDYRFGRMTFLELLDKWKEVLGLPIERE